MDYLTEGINQGNLIISCFIIVVLVIGSSKARVLDSSGIAAAVFVGLTVGVLGHWIWLLILLSFLASSHFATKWKFEDKKARNMSESDDGHRSWMNVIANGGIPTLVAALSFYSENWELGIWVFGAAVAVATSDTFASEFGCLDDNVRMITNFKKCEAGINGGFSRTGQIAALLGAAIMSVLTLIAWYATNESTNIDLGIQNSIAVLVIGFLGCQIDSLLGALFENRGLLTKGGVNALAITSGMLIMWAWLSYFV